jgi:hypothetical protein
LGDVSGTDDLLGEDLELDVADEGNATPGYWGGPQGSAIWNFALYSREVGVC